MAKSHVLLFAVLAVLYLPHVGKGFIKDDFRWIESGRVDSPRDVGRVLFGNVGFYRPIVTLSFAANYACFGLYPTGYGVTNFLLLLACCLALQQVGGSLGLSPRAASIAVALWALNFHGIGGSLLWLSGRTALLLCLFWMLSVRALLRGSRMGAIAWFILALLSKEEAVLLPALLLYCDFRTHRSFARLLPFGAALAVVLAAYAAVRAASGAFDPLNAPPYYRLTTDPALLLRNILEYADRTATYSAAAVMVTMTAVGSWRAPMPSRNLVAICAVWLLTGFAITVLVPARSSLYVLLPSVAIAIVAGAVVDGLYERSQPRARRRLVALVMVALLALMPVYWSRNRRLANLATFSHAMITSLQAFGGEIPEGAAVELVDPLADRTRNSLPEAFGSLTDSVRALAMPRAGSLVIVGKEPSPGMSSSRARVRLAVRPDRSGFERAGHVSSS